MNAKRGTFVFVLVLASVLLMSSFASAGLFDWFGKITGKVTSQPVNVNITVSDTSAPTVFNVGNVPAVNLNEGPVATIVNINFTATDVDGAANLNDTSGVVNFTRAGEAVRLNVSCAKNSTIGNNVTYTCNVPMYWFDGAGVWNVGISFKDISNNIGYNTTTTFTVNALTGFTSSPQALTWAPLSPGAVNQTSTNDPILMNNTGNQNITAGNVQLNTTSLLGETDPSKMLYANNFSVGITAGGSPPVECGATTMAASVYTAIGNAVLSRGNFTINDGNTGQEQLYFCLKYAGPELTSQAYSSDTSSRAWTLKIS